ncbi:MAG: molybdopterin-binding protein, partial [Varibaculum cambriense]|nr:molybdopterin-binding protein [Varibaculum cambriense]
MRGRSAGAVITVSDRCKSGERPDKSGPLAQELLAGYGIDVDRVRVVADGIESVQNEIRAAIAEGARVVLTTGGTGITERDLTPEATAPLLEARLDGIAWQICQQGLKATPLSSLSRGLVGIT